MNNLTHKTISKIFLNKIFYIVTYIIKKLNKTSKKRVYINLCNKNFNTNCTSKKNKLKYKNKFKKVHICINQKII